MRLTEYHLAATPAVIPLTMVVLTIAGGVPIGVHGLRKNDRTALLVGSSAVLFGLTFLLYYGLRIAPLRRAILHNRLPASKRFGVPHNRVHPANQRLRVVPHSLIPAKVVRESSHLIGQYKPVRTRSCPGGSLHMETLPLTEDEYQIRQTTSAIFPAPDSPVLMNRWIYGWRSLSSTLNDQDTQCTMELQ